MDKKLFMAELQEALGKAMPEQESVEILADYEEFFEAGRAEGRSEREIAHELGDPPRIVLSLLEKNISIGKAQVNQMHAFAPLGDRMIAFLVDSILSLFPLAFFGVANVLFIIPFYPLIVFSFASYTTPTAFKVVLARIFLAYAFLYHPVSLVLFKGQTPGKRLMQVRVVKEDGSPLRVGGALVRELLGKTIIYSVTFGLGSIISFVWSLFSKEHRTIPDAIAGTRVVSARRRQ